MFRYVFLTWRTKARPSQVGWPLTFHSNCYFRLFSMPDGGMCIAVKRRYPLNLVNVVQYKQGGLAEKLLCVSPFWPLMPASCRNNREREKASNNASSWSESSIKESFWQVLKNAAFYKHALADFFFLSANFFLHMQIIHRFFIPIAPTGLALKVQSALRDHHPSVKLFPSKLTDWIYPTGRHIITQISWVAMACSKWALAGTF